MGELFDRHVVVDWSASSSPTTGSDSIWVAVHDGVGEPALHNPPTRAAAEALLRGLADPAARTLVAIDASLGYPAGSAAAFGLTAQPPWQAWWDEIAGLLADDDANRNDRFEVAGRLNRRVAGDGPFWGRPAQRPVDGLATTKPARFPAPEFRHVEEQLRAAGRRPSSGWQLLGAGSVGSQTLTLLPILHRWYRDGGVEVWPFTTGLVAPDVRPGTTVLAETWPTAFDLDLPVGMVRDAAQVRGAAAALAAADGDGALGEWFAPPLAGDVRTVVEAEEGWVLRPLG